MNSTTFFTGQYKSQPEQGKPSFILQLRAEQRMFLQREPSNFAALCARVFLAPYAGEQGKPEAHYGLLSSPFLCRVGVGATNIPVSNHFFTSAGGSAVAKYPTKRRTWYYF